jgi:hypothetical protein
MTEASPMQGLTGVAPGEARVVQLMGRHKGTIHAGGNPILVAAGVGVVESRITRLSYAPEIAQVMLCGDRGTQPIVNTGSLYQ